MNIKEPTLPYVTTFQTRKISTKHLIPLSGYHGPILKLPPSEQTQIERIQESIEFLKKELFEVKKDRKKKGRCSAAYRDTFTTRINMINEKITTLAQSIRDIKVNRLNQQKKDFDANI